jgi:hypothetical protein
MAHKLCGIVFFVIISCTTCFGQTSFQGLTPGGSTRNDVKEVLGQPVRTISATVFEYSPPPGIARVEVAYSAGSSLVERIEVYFLTPISRTALLKKFSLPPQADARNTNTEGKLVEGFGGTTLVVLTHESADADSGVSRMAYWSQEVFDRALGRRTNTAQQPKSGSSPGPISAVKAPGRVADVTGTWRVTLSISDDVIGTGKASLKQTGDNVTGWVGPDEGSRHSQRSEENDPIPFTGILTGDKLTIKMSPQPGRTVAFNKIDLTVNGDKMVGTIDTNKEGKIEFVRTTP